MNQVLNTEGRCSAEKMYKLILEIQEQETLPREWQEAIVLSIYRKKVTN